MVGAARQLVVGPVRGVLLGHARASTASARATTCSTTSSRVCPVPSMWTAPSACTRGAVERPESIRSRLSSDSWVGGQVGAALLGGPPLGAGRGVGGQEDLHLRVGRDDGADVTTLDDDAAVADDVALELEQPGPHRGDGADRADGGVDLVGADRQGHVDAVDHDAGAARVGADQDLGLGHPGGDRAGVVHVDVVPQQPPGHRAEHRAGVQVAQTESRGDAARGAGLARSGRAVDRDDEPGVALDMVGHGGKPTRGSANPVIPETC